jgi:hypothetical protein
MVDRFQLLVHAAGQAMEHISETDRGDGRGAKRKRHKQIDLVQLRLEAGEPRSRAVESIAVGVEQDEALQLWRRGALEQQTRAHARLQMIGR